MFGKFIRDLYVIVDNTTRGMTEPATQDRPVGNSSGLSIRLRGGISKTYVLLVRVQIYVLKTRCTLKLSITPVSQFTGTRYEDGHEGSVAPLTNNMGGGKNIISPSRRRFIVGNMKNMC